MSDYSTNEVGNETRDNEHFPAHDELTHLRRLLLGFEESELDKLHERLNNPNIHAEDISRVLPEAVILRSMQDKLLRSLIV